MYALSRIEKKYRPVNKFLVLLLSIFFALVLIITSVKVTLNLRQLYKFDIDYLKIDQLANMKKEDMLTDYNILIDYLKPSYKSELKFSSLPMSKEGKIHFEDVKGIFVKLEYLLYISLFFSIIGIIYCIKKRDPAFLKWSSIITLLLPVLLAIPFAVNFDKTFTRFHKIFFKNDYWLFDPKTDPIINMLPQEFFFHCAVLILIILTIESIIMSLIYRKIRTRKKSAW